MILTNPAKAKTLAQPYVNESDLRNFRYSLHRNEVYFNELFEKFSEIYGPENVIFKRGKDISRCHLGVQYGENSVYMLSMIPRPQSLTYSMGHIFKSNIFKDAAREKGYKHIEQNRYNVDEGFSDITVILEECQKTINFYAKKHGLNSYEEQMFATFVEMFDITYRKADKGKKVWKSYPDFYKYVAAIIKTSFSKKYKHAFIENSVPLEMVESLYTAPEEWINQIIELHNV